jgi:hypothetical protein
MITIDKFLFNGENFNDRLSAILLSYDSNQDISIADALHTKQQSKFNNNVVFYIEIPKLVIPKPKIRLTKVNDILFHANR